MKEIRARGGALAVQRPLASVCSVEDCWGVTHDGDIYCPRCREEIDALDLMTAMKGADRRQAERDERVKRFIAVLLFMLAGEGIFSFAFDLPFTWAWLLINMGWALLIAALAGFFCARSGR